MCIIAFIIVIYGVFNGAWEGIYHFLLSDLQRYFSISPVNKGLRGIQKWSSKDKKGFYILIHIKYDKIHKENKFRNCPKNIFHNSPSSLH